MNLEIRTMKPGDLGTVVARHGETYARDYGWDLSFEAAAADVLVRLVHNDDPEWERSWIAEKDGCFAGCIFIMKEDPTTARLRMLFVESHARGLGLGRRLVDECIAFCRSRPYRKIRLWTCTELAVARGIYQRRGFRLIEEETVQRFGKTLYGEFWELDL